VTLGIPGPDEIGRQFRMPAGPFVYPGVPAPSRASTIVTPLTSKQRLRVHEIDGVRGWAALSVLLYHFFWLLLGNTLTLARSPELHFWLNGPLAVYIFFVLSGDALSWPFVSTGDTLLLDKTVLKRYFRLAIPIFYSSAIVYLLMRAHLIFNREAGPIVGSSWLGGFLSFSPSALSLVNFSFSRVFLDFAAYPNSYNRFLWPMPVELVGSFLVFGFCYSIARRHRALHLTLAAALITLSLSEYFSLFFAGLCFALLRQRGVFDRLRASAFGRFGAPALIVAAIAIDTIDSTSRLFLNDRAPIEGRLYSILAIVIVFGIYSNRGLVHFFGNRVSRWLGTVSFPIYLLHFAVMCSLTSFLLLETTGRGGPGIYTAIATISILVTLAAAWGFEKLERYSLRRIDHVLGSLLGPPLTHG